MKGLIAAACCAIVIACAANRQQTMAPASAPSSEMPGSPQDHQIQQLAAEIDQQRVALGLPEAPTNGVPSMAGSAERVCRPAETDTCKQSCTLSDSICTNAKKICALAEQLQNDTWANQKCTDASATCEAAHQKCCACQP